MRYALIGRRIYLLVGACALLVYLGALWNSFALDDLYIIPLNPLIRSGKAAWLAFAAPYWPAHFGSSMYRPLPIATYGLDWLTHSTAWFHFVNLMWHAGASVLVAVLARHWAGDRAALIAGLLFAVHPVHVEAVANVVGRGELMAAVFVMLAVWAALEHRSVAWSAAAFGLGLLSKENAAVAPAIVAWGWIVGFARPSRARILAFVGAWVLVFAAYIGVRMAVLGQQVELPNLAPVFTGQSPLSVRLTAIAALADAARLLVLPVKLRADYGPAERMPVDSVFDERFALGLAAVVAWGVLLLLSWRRGRKVEAFGLGWIGVSYLPVANLMFPIGILIAERTLYLPSAGLALALGAWGSAAAGAGTKRSPHSLRVLRAAFVVVILLGAVRTVLRVPVWKNDVSLTVSILSDSPRSYRALARAGMHFQAAARHSEALEAFRSAIAIYERDPGLLVGAADAAFAVGKPFLADSLLDRVEAMCTNCTGLYGFQASAARTRGDVAIADSLLARATRRTSH